MNSLLFLAIGAVVLVIFAAQSSSKLRGIIAKHSVKASLLPQAITLLVLTAQVSELVKVVEHVSPINIAAALFLLAIVAAAKSGTESDLL